MRLIHKYVAPLLFSAVLATPVIASAATMQAGVQVRVYDSGHKDYHNWDDHEDKAWVTYQDAHHIKHHEFKKANKKEQKNYWAWRHDHPDHPNR